jgi:vacuolar-type H+-ATPase subunit B/Vma2
MSSYADAFCEVSAAVKKSLDAVVTLGYMYTDLSTIYERAGRVVVERFHYPIAPF